MLLGLHHIFDDAADGCLECPGKTRRLMNECLKRLAHGLMLRNNIGSRNLRYLGHIIMQETRETRGFIEKDFLQGMIEDR